jgi:hypothetical protein
VIIESNPIKPGLSKTVLACQKPNYLNFHRLYK